MNVASEHDLVDFGSQHHEMLHHDAKRHAHNRADERKEHGLAEDVGVHFARRETKHFKRGDFALTFGDVDVRQVVEHDERKRCGRDHEHDDDRVDTAQHRAVRAHRLVVEAGGLHAVDTKQLVGKRLALAFVARRLRVVGREGRLRAEALLVGVRSHEHVLAHVVFHDARDRELVLLPRRVADSILFLDDERVTDRKAEFRRELFRQDHAVFADVESLPAFTVAHVDEPFEHLAVAWHHEFEALFVIAAFDGRDHVLGMHGREVAHRIALRERFLHLLLALFRSLVARAHHEVIVVDIVELLVDDVVDGILQAKPRQQQRRTAGNADDGHEETPLIAEYVARRDFPGERKPAPQRANPLEQNALARLRRARQHKRCRGLAQRRVRRKTRCRQGDADAQSRRQDCQTRVDGRGPKRHGINNAIRILDENRQELRKRRDADQTADAARHRSVDQVFGGNTALSVAERFVRADQHALFVDHARHSRQAHQRGD